MYLRPRPSAPAKSISAAPFIACPIRWNMSGPLADVGLDTLRVALVLQDQLAAPRRARLLGAVQGCVGRGPAVVGGRLAGREAHGQDDGEGGPHPITGA